jgi:hypothetical protein
MTAAQALLPVLLLAAAGALAAPRTAPWLDPLDFLRETLAATCSLQDSGAAALGRRLDGGTLAEEKVLRAGGQAFGWRRRYRLAAGDELVLVRQSRDGLLLRYSVEYFGRTAGGGPMPVAMAIAGSDCRIFHGRSVRRDPEGRAVALLLLGPDLTPSGASEALNPPVPAGRDPGGVAIALFDSGLNYTLPTFSDRLARDREGALLGYDFWDMDARPFDSHPAASPFFPARHGTAVASVLLNEAPATARLLPYRYPRPDMTRMADMVEAAGTAGARIVAMPMGSNQARDWSGFAAAARAHPEILFVVSAGNNGRDIDDRPLYPAALPLDNLLVVTSADGAGRLAPGSNWGPESVDLLVPAEDLAVVDFLGAPTRGSGSSFAVPRVAALAARLLSAHPRWRAPELKAAILARAAPWNGPGPSPIRHGWIADPTGK